MSHSIRPYGAQPPAHQPPAGQLRPIPQQLPAMPDLDAPAFDLHDMRMLSGFPRRAFRRRRRLGMAIFAAVLLSSIAASVLLQRHYYVETKFFAEKNMVMPALGNPRRAVPSEGDAPTKLAADAVMQRENLIEIIRETNLLGKWAEVRSPMGKAKDQLMTFLRGPMSDSDRVQSLVGMMENRMWVGSNEGTVTIGIDWVHPIMAYSIVQAAQQNFFEQRHVSEVSMIGESIGILEGHVEAARQSIQDAVAQIKATRRSTASTAPVRAVHSVSPQAVALQAELTTKGQTIADLENSRQQQLTALQTHLTDLKNKYGAAHPEVIATQENIRAMMVESPQIVQLKAEDQSLRRRIVALGATPGSVVATSPQAMFTREAIDRLTRVSPDSEEDPTVTYARSQLKIATNNYEDLLDRLEGARIELETARAAFKYRYHIITPPQIPQRARRPNVPVLIVGGVMLGALLALFVTVALDLMSGMVLERWQVDRQLGIPVLADVRLP
jgi:uncharacterized protein involved in exopolysaccharide biosynthesis